MGWWSRWSRRMGHEQWVADIAKRALPPLDRFLHRISGGRIRFADSLFPTLILTTIGRKTGKPRTQPLAYLEVDDGWAVAATNFGQEHHPAWSHNLLANPQAKVEIGDRTHRVMARLASGEEREQLWSRFVEMWPAYDTYEHRTNRDIRVFVLEAIGGRER